MPGNLWRHHLQSVMPAADIHSFLEAVDRDRRRLMNPSELGRGWTVSGSMNSERGADVIRLRDLLPAV
jgi:hypothetical protein